MKQKRCMSAMCLSKTRLIKDNRRLLFLLSVVSSLTLGSVILVSRAHNQPTLAPAISTSEVESGPIANTAQSGQPTKSGPVQVIRFALCDVGIYPHEAHASSNVSVAVSFEDLSGGNSDVVVARQIGSSLQAIVSVRRVDQHSRGRADLQLPSGRYKVYVADHPENSATLIID